RNEPDDDLSSLKKTVPKFYGKSDPKEYVDWEQAMDNLFECHNNSEGKKVIIAAVEFTSYASIWWKQQCREREQ
ncbi:hypothetical protein LINGRAHAP2_LOCUS28892, partial [Linum grandiflorum]